MQQPPPSEWLPGSYLKYCFKSIVVDSCRVEQLHHGDWPVNGSSAFASSHVLLHDARPPHHHVCFLRCVLLVSARQTALTTSKHWHCGWSQHLGPPVALSRSGLKVNICISSLGRRPHSVYYFVWRIKGSYILHENRESCFLSALREETDVMLFAGLGICSPHIVWAGLFFLVVSENDCVIGQNVGVGVVNAEKWKSFSTCAESTQARLPVQYIITPRAHLSEHYRLVIISRSSMRIFGQTSKNAKLRIVVTNLSIHFKYGCFLVYLLKHQQQNIFKNSWKKKESPRKESREDSCTDISEKV